MWDQGLKEAIAEGDTLKTLLIIEGATDVNYVKCEGDRTALMLCAQYGDESAINLLLSKGADVNAEQSFGMTALHIACANGNVESAKLLLQGGAKIDHVNVDGESALFVSIESGHLSCVDLLIEHGVNVNDKNFYQGLSSPLDCAIYFHQEDITQRLIDLGSFVNAPNHEGSPPLFTAVHSDFIGGVDILLKVGADPFIKNERGDSPVNWAYRFNKSGSIQLLQSHGHITEDSMPT